MKISFQVLTFLTLSLIPISAQVDVNLFDFWKYYSDAENSMYRTSCELAFHQLDLREAEIAGLKTSEDFLERQAKVNEKLNRILGPLPEKTPLNAKITGVIKKDDYRVEKILFESIPGYYVTAALFLPVPRKGKLPVVIYASGHTANGFRSETYQYIAINLVKKGFAVFAFDPVGQGERWQYFNNDGNRRFRNSTIEHSYPGAQCYISGYSPTNYFVWDGIRSVDYLLTRKDIDPHRIGMTGRSGGGTQTAYTAAIDDRILAAAPECYITNMEYIFKSIGPQDAEQNLYQMISQGLDHADLLEVRAPKPALIITTTRDFFSIQGARETFKEVQKFYSGLDAVQHIDMVEDDDEHNSTKKNREAMYAFFQKYLDNPGSAEDMEVEIFDEQELWVTKTGNVATSFQGETLYSLNKKVVQEQVGDLNGLRGQQSHLSEVLTSVKKLSGFEYPMQCKPAIFSGRTQEAEYQLEKYLVPGGGDYQLPVVLFKPKNNQASELVLILDELGMEHAVSQDIILYLVKRGYSVLIADLPGTGSLGPGYLKGDAYVDNTSFNQWFAGILTGKSIVAMRAEDMVRITHFVISELEHVEAITGISIGTLASGLLHAAVFDKDITRICMIDPFLSYAEIAMTPDYKPSFITSVVAGAINSYDLPDLMAALSPRELLMLNPLNAMGEEYGNEEISSLLNYPGEVYGNAGASANFQVASGLNENQVLEKILEWLR